MTPERAAEIVKLLNKHPNLIWNNRLGGTYKGDTETPEQFIPAQGYPGRDWESCMTMNDTWGYKSYDTNFKSTETLLRNLIDIASKGGNYLLNIGPDSHGIVPAPEVERLQQMGQWLNVNGEAIYNTKATLFDVPTGTFSDTEKDSDGKPKVHPHLELALHHRPQQDLHRNLHTGPPAPSTSTRLPRNVTSAYLLADPAHKPLKLTQTGEGLDIQLSRPSPRPHRHRPRPQHHQIRPQTTPLALKGRLPSLP